MKLKLDANGQVVVVDGKPVYIADDGKEVVFDAVAATNKIKELNGEAQGKREALETAVAKLKTFEGITDPVAALKAIETMKNIDDKKLVDAGQVEAVKAAAVKGYDEKLASLATNHAAALKKLEDERDGIRGTYHDTLLTNSFVGSKFIGDKIAIPADLVQARFARSFKVEDGKIIGYDHAGNKLMSRAKPGDPADFEEALEMLVDAYPQKDNILKGTQHSGGGGKGGKEGGERRTAGETGNLGGTPAERAAVFAKRFPELAK